MTIKSTGIPTAGYSIVNHNNARIIRKINPPRPPPPPLPPPPPYDCPPPTRAKADCNGKTATSATKRMAVTQRTRYRLFRRGSFISTRTVACLEVRWDSHRLQEH